MADDPRAYEPVRIVRKHAMSYVDNGWWVAARLVWGLITIAVLVVIAVFAGKLLARRTAVAISVSNDTVVLNVTNQTVALSVTNQTVALSVTNQTIVCPTELDTTIVGPFGECTAENSLCVTLSADNGPIDVNVVDATFNVTANFTLAPELNVTLTGPFGEVCTAENSLCVSVLNDEPLDVNVVGPLTLAATQPTLNTTCTVDGAVDTVITGPYGEVCTEDNSLCVSLLNDEPLDVNVTNPLTLADTQPTLNATCTVDGAVDVVIAGPLGALPGDQSVSVVLSPDSVPVDVAFPDEVLGAECTQNTSLCVTLAADTPPLDVNVVNVGLNISANVMLNPNMTLHNILVGPYGPLLVNESISVALAIDQPPILVDTEATIGSCALGDALCVTLTADQAPLDVTVTNAQLDVHVTNPSGVIVGYDGNFTDVFNRLRVSIPSTRFDVKMTTSYADALNFDNVQVSGSGTSTTWSQPRAAQFLNVSAATAGRRVRKSLRSFNYQPGKGMLIMMTVIPHDTPANVTKRWGYFSAGAGYFFEMTGTNQLFTVVRSSSSGSPVDTRTDVTALVPPGFSVENGNIWVINFAWLGFGVAQFSIYTGDSVYWVLSEDIGSHSVVTIDNPNQPVTYEIENSGAGAASALECICVVVVSEAGEGPIGTPVAVNRGASAVSLTTDGVVHSLLAVRLNPTAVGASTAYVSDFTITTTTAGSTLYMYSFIYRPTVAGAALSWTATTNSPIQYAIPVAANTVTGGEVLSSGYTIGTSQGRGVVANTPQSIFLGSLLDGTPLEMHLCVQQLGGNADTYYASVGLSTIS